MCYAWEIVDNARIARAFDELADLLELAGEGPFKVRAYREFAKNAAAWPEPIEAVARRGALTTIDGVGKAIDGKVKDLLATGTFAALERARARVPGSLRELLRVPGLGAKTIVKLWREARIASLRELASACEEDRLAALPGFGKKKQDKTLVAVRMLLEGEGAMLLAAALEASGRIARLLGEERVLVVGEARRGVSIVKELVLLLRDGDPDALVAKLLAARDDLACTPPARIGDDVLVAFDGAGRVVVRSVPRARWVQATIEATGNDAHVAWLEGRAAAHGGLEAVCARASREEDVYAALGVPWAPPELRESPTPDVPALVENVQGVFHVHTDWSDGTASIVAMAREAARAGFAYVGISDHSRAASYANGLDAARLAEQAHAVQLARAEVPEIAILHGVEVDILEDGSLDLDDATLGALDFVIASVHTTFAMDKATMTARIVRAVSHPLVTMLGHPTGRLLLGRKGYVFDVEEVARAAAANDTCLEINANAQRLDLSDLHARRAAAAGARLVVNPDAHATIGFADTHLGVTVARRAALDTPRVLNAMGKDAIVATLAERKRRALARLAER